IMTEVKNKVTSHLGSLFEIVSEGIVVVDSKQIIVAYNQVLNDIFGYDNNELLGESIHILVPQERHNVHKKQIESYNKNASNRQIGVGRDLYGIKKDGTKFPVEVGLNPFTIEGDKYVMAILIDISVRKKHEKQIKDLNKKLEHRINERTLELEKTVIDLEAEIKRREEAESKILESLRVERELNELKTKFLSDRKSTRLNSSHVSISYAVFCLKKKKTMNFDEGRAAGDSRVGDRGRGQPGVIE